jgi:hypothetical protein
MIDDVCIAIVHYMKQQTHYDAAQNKAFISLSANPSTLQSVLEITGRYMVDCWPPYSLRSVLGFKNRVYQAGFNESEKIINILIVSSIFVEVDIINGSYVNGKLSLSFIRSSQTSHLGTRLLRTRLT